MKNRLSKVVLCAVMLVSVCASILSTPAYAEDKVYTYYDVNGSIGKYEQSNIQGTVINVKNVDGVSVYSGFTGDLRFYYVKSTGVLAIIGNGAMAEYDGYHQTPWYQHCESVKSVVISEGVTKISKEAFAGNNTIECVSLPSTLSVIPESAFANALHLSTVFIPDGVKEIGSNAFSGCEALNMVYIPQSLELIGEGAFSGCRLKQIRYNGTEELWNGRVNILSNNTRVEEAQKLFSDSHVHGFAENEHGIFLCKECYTAKDGWADEFEKKMNYNSDSASLSKPDIDLSLFFVPNSTSGIGTPFVIACFAVALCGIFACMFTKNK